MRRTQNHIKLPCKRHLGQCLALNQRLNILYLLVMLLVVLAGTPLARGASSQLSLDVIQTIGNGLDPLSNEAHNLGKLKNTLQSLTFQAIRIPETWAPMQYERVPYDVFYDDQCLDRCQRRVVLRHLTASIAWSFSKKKQKKRLLIKICLLNSM